MIQSYLFNIGWRVREAQRGVAAWLPLSHQKGRERARTRGRKPESERARRASLLALLDDLERVLELQVDLLVVIDEPAEGVVLAAGEHAAGRLLPLVVTAREDDSVRLALRAVAAEHLLLRHHWLGQQQQASVLQSRAREERTSAAAYRRRGRG